MRTGDILSGESKKIKAVTKQKLLFCKKCFV